HGGDDLAGIAWSTAETASLDRQSGERYREDAARSRDTTPSWRWRSAGERHSGFAKGAMQLAVRFGRTNPIAHTPFAESAARIDAPSPQNKTGGAIGTARSLLRLGGLP